MKVIFLDIDGVLITDETYRRKYNSSGLLGLYELTMDEFRVEYLKEIIDQTDAKIVLSSSYKYFFDEQDGRIVPTTVKGIAINRIFSRYGIEIYDKTPKLLENRENEIKEWLSTREDIEDFIIIDDEPTWFMDFKEKLIKTCESRRDFLTGNIVRYTGLCDYHVEQAVRKLNVNEIKR